MVVAGASQVKELAAWSAEGSVSLFLPLRPVSGKEAGDALRLKNLVSRAEEELVVLGMRPPEASQLCAHVDAAILTDPSSPVFHRAGVGFFVAPEMNRVYQLVVDSPMLVTVGRRFHLKPLLAGLAQEVRFFILAITRGSATLFAGSRTDLREIDVPDLPASLDDAVLYDDREAVLTSHGASRGGGGEVVAAFHGQGDRFDHLTEDLARYLRMVDRAVRRRIGDGGLLVLAGSRDVVARYRELTEHRRVVPDGVFGNPADMAPGDLHGRALAIAESAASAPGDDVERFRALDGTGTASSVPATIIEAAHHGRIDTMFVAADAQLWGTIELGRGPQLHVDRRPGDEDLLDTAATEAWKAGATVHVVSDADVPAENGIAAIFRY